MGVALLRTALLLGHCPPPRGHRLAASLVLPALSACGPGCFRLSEWSFVLLSGPQVHPELSVFQTHRGGVEVLLLWAEMGV